jgi:hypothetical protein
MAPSFIKPKDLLKAVLKGDSQTVIEFAAINPALLFQPAVANASAAGIREDGKTIYRRIEATPFQALLGEGNIWLLKKLFAVYADKIVDKEKCRLGCEVMAEQFDQQFPQGVDYAPSSCDIHAFIEAITRDDCLIEGNMPRRLTLLAMDKFRSNQLKNQARTGYYCNLNDLRKACSLASDNWKNWNDHQRLFYFINVVGYLERMVSAIDAKAICAGIERLKDNDAAIDEHGFMLANGDEPIAYFPLDQRLTCRLGVSFAATSNTEGRVLETSDSMKEAFANLDPMAQKSIMPKLKILEYGNHLAAALFELDNLLLTLIQRKTAYLKEWRNKCDPERYLTQMKNNLVNAVWSNSPSRAKAIYAIKPELLFCKVRVNDVDETPMSVIFRFKNMKVLLDILGIYADNELVMSNVFNQYKSNHLKISYYNNSDTKTFDDLVKLFELAQRGKFNYNEKGDAIRRIVELFRDESVGKKFIDDCYTWESLNEAAIARKKNPPQKPVKDSWREPRERLWPH